jgi:hypothetical protein
VAAGKTSEFLFHRGYLDHLNVEESEASQSTVAILKEDVRGNNASNDVASPGPAGVRAPLRFPAHPDLHVMSSAESRWLVFQKPRQHAAGVGGSRLAPVRA